MKRKDEISDEEEARIQRMIAADPNNPEWTGEDFAAAVPFAQAFPAMAETIKRGRPKSDSVKVAISLRIDREIVERYRATGSGWQSRMNADLRKAADRL